MKVLLVHGAKTQPNKALNPVFEERLKLSIKLDQENDYDLILISGGQTRKKFPAESSIGYEYLIEKVKAEIVQEDKSLTTIENIKFSKKILGQYNIGQLDIVTSQSCLFRFKYLWKRLWPEVYSACNFYGAKDYYSIFHRLLELIYFLYAVLDVQEVFLPKLAKKFFRNG